MARVECPVVVISATTGLPISGASVAIKLRSTGANATWWTQETGGTSSTAAVTTDASGRVSAWVDRGAYNCVVTGTGITTYTEPWDASPASDAAIDAPWLGPAVLPAGLILPYGGAAAPTGWLMCDGSEVLRATYAALDNVIGTAYGAYTNGSGAAGTTHLRVPDFKGRTPVGAGAGAGLTTRARGDSGGTETHALTAAQMPPHTHPPPGSDNFALRRSGDSMVYPGAGALLMSQYETGATGSAGGSGGSVVAHPNMQPWLAVSMIIKY